jgi:hypothetical protein
MLRRYFQIDERDGRNEIQKRVVMHILQLDNTLKAAIHPILSLLDGLPEEDQSPTLGEAHWFSHQQDLLDMVKRFGAMDLRQRRREILDAIKRVLIRESQRQPLVLVLEDLHWIDTQTQAFLDMFAECFPLNRILLLVDYRPGYNHGWIDKTYFTELRIDPLQPGGSEELFEHLLGPNTPRRPYSLLSKLGSWSERRETIGQTYASIKSVFRQPRKTSSQCVLIGCHPTKSGFFKLHLLSESSFRSVY